MIKNTVLTTLFLLLTVLHAKTYYAAANGSSSNTGLSITSPWDLALAGYGIAPGDTVLLRGGTYTSSANDILYCSVSGTSGNPVVYKNYPGEIPMLQMTDTNNAGIKIYGAKSYIIIDGITLNGIADKNGNPQGTVTYALAMAEYQAGRSSNKFNGFGIVIMGQDSSNCGHHITVQNCVVTNMCGAGIGSGDADYISFLNNKVSYCATRSVWANSGISIFHSYNSDTVTGTKNLIQGNISHHNTMEIPWLGVGAITDGNGIIIDDNKNSQTSSLHHNAPYLGATYVSNNLVYNNGGSGIHAFYSQNITIVNNTSYANDLQIGQESDGELFAAYSTNCNILNNIIYGHSASKPLGYTTGNINVSYFYNLFFNGSLYPAGNLSGDPMFVDAANGGFALGANSQAIDKANPNWFETYDILGKSRVGNADVGCYEYIPATALLLDLQDNSKLPRARAQVSQKLTRRQVQFSDIAQPVLCQPSGDMYTITGKRLSTSAASGYAAILVAGKK